MQGQKYQKTSYANHQSLRIGFYFLLQNVNVIMGYAVAHLVEALRYKPMASLEFFIDVILRDAIWPWG